VAVEVIVTVNVETAGAGAVDCGAIEVVVGCAEDIITLLIGELASLDELTLEPGRTLDMDV